LASATPCGVSAVATRPSSGGLAQAARYVRGACACYTFDQPTALAAGGPMNTGALPSRSGEPEPPAREQRGQRRVLCPLERVANGHLLDPRVGGSLASATGPAQAALVSVSVNSGVQEPSGPLGGGVDD
jgi:hypothetical protein